MVTLADICQEYGPAYEAAFGDQLLPSHRQALRAIVQCRTAAMDGHVYQCDACEQTHYCYHSCRNRHCPQCQGDKAADWLTRQEAMLLPTPYFMLTFTLPAELRPFARSHQRLFYNLLFRASAEATQQLAHNPRFLGGDIGMVGVLHTWTRDLAYHPHVHYLVPAGAWDGQVWCRPRCQRFCCRSRRSRPCFAPKSVTLCARRTFGSKSPRPSGASPGSSIVNEWVTGNERLVIWPLTSFASLSPTAALFR